MIRRDVSFAGCPLYIEWVDGQSVMRIVYDGRVIGYVVISPKGSLWLYYFGERMDAQPGTVACAIHLATLYESAKAKGKAT